VLYKRPDNPNWWIRFRIRGREIRCSARTRNRAQAERLEKRLRDNVWSQSELGETSHTWDEATARWLKEKASKRSLARDREAFEAVAEFLHGAALREITPEHLAKLRQIIEKGRASSTVVRLLAPVKSVLRAATTWGWISRVPTIQMPKIERGEPRFITRQEFEKLAKELPPHVRAMARFSVETGQRYSSVAKLQWSAVDLKRRHAFVTSSTSKSKRPIAIPLNTAAISILKGQIGKHDTCVFADQLGRAPVGSVKTAWHKAVERAGLKGFRWHDLRHTWASWHTMAGTPPIALKELGGWASLAMVERYSHLSAGHLAQWAEAGTKTGTAIKAKRR
jgi:integrase